MQDNPTFLKPRNILNGEASDTRTEKQNRKFIAGIFVPVMID
jgi:hypothetical protein